MSGVPRCAQCLRPESEHDNGKCPPLISYLDRATDPGNASHGVVQVVFTPAVMRSFRAWLEGRGAHLYPVPNGHDAAGRLVFDNPDDLPTFAVGFGCPLCEAPLNRDGSCSRSCAGVGDG